MYVLPADTALVGTELFLQAAVMPPVTPALQFTNGLRIRIGF